MSNVRKSATESMAGAIGTGAGVGVVAGALATLFSEKPNLKNLARNTILGGVGGAAIGGGAHVSGVSGDAVDEPSQGQPTPPTSGKKMNLPLSALYGAVPFVGSTVHGAVEGGLGQAVGSGAASAGATLLALGNAPQKAKALGTHISGKRQALAVGASSVASLAAAIAGNKIREPEKTASARFSILAGQSGLTKSAAKMVKKTETREENFDHCPHCDYKFGEKCYTQKVGLPDDEQKRKEAIEAGNYDEACPECNGIIDGDEMSDADIEDIIQHFPGDHTDQMRKLYITRRDNQQRRREEREKSASSGPSKKTIEAAMTAAGLPKDVRFCYAGDRGTAIFGDWHESDVVEAGNKVGKKLFKNWEVPDCSEIPAPDWSKKTACSDTKPADIIHDCLAIDCPTCGKVSRGSCLDATDDDTHEPKRRKSSPCRDCQNNDVSKQASFMKEARPAWAKAFQALSSASKKRLTTGMTGPTRQLPGKPLGVGAEGVAFPAFTPGKGESVIKQFYDKPKGLGVKGRSEVMNSRPDLFAKVHDYNEAGGRMVVERMNMARQGAKGPGVPSDVMWPAAAGKRPMGVSPRLSVRDVRSANYGYRPGSKKPLIVDPVIEPVGDIARLSSMPKTQQLRAMENVSSLSNIPNIDKARPWLRSYAQQAKTEQLGRLVGKLGDAGVQPNQLQQRLRALSSPAIEAMDETMPMFAKTAAMAGLRKARKDTDTSPSASQAEAGNYKKGKFSFHGISCKIENPKGSERKGYDDDGEVIWRSKMHADYGYVTGTEAIDGDEIDFFMGPDTDAEMIVAVDQYKDAGNKNFDETKFLFGVKSKEEGEKLYLKHYPRGWRLGPSSTTTIAQFKEWLKNGDHKKPFKGQMVKAAKAAPAESVGDFLRGDDKGQDWRWGLLGLPMVSAPVAAASKLYTKGVMEPLAGTKSTNVTERNIFRKLKAIAKEEGASVHVGRNNLEVTNPTTPRNLLRSAFGKAMKAAPHPTSYNPLTEMIAIDRKHMSPGVLAHELGHKRGGGKLMLANILGKQGLGAFSQMGLLAPTEKSGLILSGVGTAMAGGLLASEVDASRRGYQAVRKLGGGRGAALKAFAGLPTYMAAAGLPLAGHFTKKELGGYEKG